MIAERLSKALKNVLATGINGGDNLRLVYIGMSNRALTASDRERSELSEAAVNEAREALAEYTLFKDEFLFVLKDSVSQMQYLDNKFGPLGTTELVLSRAKALIEKIENGTPTGTNQKHE